MFTKFDEILHETSNIEEMQEKYLGKRLLRTWSEDFVDEDNGEVISIERNEIILEKGTFLDANNLQTINFHLQSGDIKTVIVSNQKRDCLRAYNGVGLWVANIEINRKKKNIYLYADSLENASLIVTDYVEQMHSGRFMLKGLKETDYVNLITENKDEDDNDNDDFKEEETENIYLLNVEIEEEDGSYRNSFIMKSNNVDNSKKIVEDYLLKKKLENNIEPEFTVSVIQAKPIPCNFIIEPNFSLKHIEEYKKKD